jgi:error-prone DNA polymerase
MGFYSASQLTQDLRRHGTQVRAVGVNDSDWDSSLEINGEGQPALRLGLRQIKGLSESVGRAIQKQRGENPYDSVQDLLERAQLERRDLNVLAASGALSSLTGHRHKARWSVAGVEKPTRLFPAMDRYEPTPMLRRPTEGQDIVADYKTLGLTLERHPLALVRPQLLAHDYLTAGALKRLPTGSRVKVAGIVITKQRPGTASGVTFVTLEDESGYTNLIVWKKIAEGQRSVLLNARLMGVDGILQAEGKVIHVIARRLIDHSEMLGELALHSRDFR